MTSPLILVYVFAALIALGTLLLLLPFSRNADGFTPFVTALFTSTSAVTVTGLTVENTATYWTRFGQVVILALTFFGGLGYMTLATFLLIIIGQRFTLAQRLLVKESFGVDQVRGLVRLGISIAAVSIAIQVLGFFALFGRFLVLYSPAEAVWQAAFHAVSAFNNAGFVALADSDGLANFRSDEAVIGIIAALVFLGGLGYWIMADIYRTRKLRRLSLNTKLILAVTFALIFTGMGVFLSSEYQNSETLGPMPVEGKVVTSVFHSISARSAGFNTIDFGETLQETNFIFIGLMFIGGASASVAGGIKLNTVVILMIAVIAITRGRGTASVLGRELPQEQIQRAMIIGALATGIVFFLATLLTFVEEEFDFLALLFETVSAFGTVGLSTGATPTLSSPGHLILAMTMIIGRLAPLMIALVITQRAKGDRYRLPSERVTIG